MDPFLSAKRKRIIPPSLLRHSHLLPQEINQVHVPLASDPVSSGFGCCRDDRLQGERGFRWVLTKFWECWRGRAWEEDEDEKSETSRASETVASQGLYGNDGTVRMVGLAGILRKEQEQWESTNKSLQDAFQDLNALMSKAKEMVSLAEKMRQKLLSAPSSQNGSGDDEEMGSKEEMHQWMLSVGIISPVTKESAGAL